MTAGVHDFAWTVVGAGRRGDRPYEFSGISLRRTPTSRDAREAVPDLTFSQGSGKISWFRSRHTASLPSAAANY